MLFSMASLLGLSCSHERQETWWSILMGADNRSLTPWTTEQKTQESPDSIIGQSGFFSFSTPVDGRSRVIWREGERERIQDIILVTIVKPDTVYAFQFPKGKLRKSLYRKGMFSTLFKIPGRKHVTERPRVIATHSAWLPSVCVCMNRTGSIQHDRPVLRDLSTQNGR